MKCLLCLSLLVFVLMPGQVQAFTAKVTATMQSQNNSVVVVQMVTVTGSALLMKKEILSLEISS